MIINLSLTNSTLYKGCRIEEIGGRLSLITDPATAANIIGRNVAATIEAETDRASVTLTGPMAVWAYLIIFHLVVHKFGQVWYDDGRSGAVQIAQH
jgi:hypothetical protein